jgi:hypothetical protein
MSNNGQPTRAESGDLQPPTHRPSAGRGPSSGKLLLLVALGGIVGIVAARQVIVTRRTPPLTEEALDAAIERWSEHGPADYDLDFEIRGERPGTVHAEVRGGEVVAFQRDGATPDQTRTWQYWSVPARFEEIERELELAADPTHEMQLANDAQLVLRCEFDVECGYPRVFHRVVYGGGPEVYWRVTDFQPK